MISGTAVHISGMVRLAIPTVEVIAPDGTKSLWVVALPYTEAAAAVRKIIPHDHIAELAIRRLPSSPKLGRLRPGEVRKIEPFIPKRPSYQNWLAKIGPAKGMRPDFSRTIFEYQAYAIARDGQLMAVNALTCNDDRDAVAEAKRLARYSDIEVWNGDRFIIRLVRRPK